MDITEQSNGGLTYVPFRRCQVLQKIQLFFIPPQIFSIHDGLTNSTKWTCH